MTQKQKEHIKLAIAVLVIVHLLFCYSHGTLYTMTLSKDERDFELTMILVAQLFTHIFWINKENLIKSLKDEE